MAKKKRTEAEMLAIDEKIKELLLQDKEKTTNDIAKEVGIYHNRVTIVRKKLLAEAYDVIPPKDRYSDQSQKDECLKLYLDGHAPREIAQIMEMSISWVQNTIQERMQMTGGRKVDSNHRVDKKFDNVSMKIKTEWDDVTLDILVLLVQQSAKKVLAIRKRRVER